jgi:hypothetical protein
MVCSHRVGQILSDGSETNSLEFVTIPVSKIIYKSIINMEDISQVFNQLLGRQEDYNGVAYWEEPERCGWLMKQGTRVCYVEQRNKYVYISVKGILCTLHGPRFQTLRLCLFVLQESF